MKVRVNERESEKVRRVGGIESDESERSKEADIEENREVEGKTRGQPMEKKGGQIKANKRRGRRVDRERPREGAGEGKTEGGQPREKKGTQREANQGRERREDKERLLEGEGEV